MPYTAIQQYCHGVHNFISKKISLRIVDNKGKKPCNIKAKKNRVGRESYVWITLPKIDKRQSIRPCI